MSNLSPHTSHTDAAALFGHDPTSRLVAVHPVLQGADARQAMMRVYQRDATCSMIYTADVPFYPFFFLTDIRLLQGFPREKFRCKTLQGSNAYRYLVVFTSWQTHWDAVSHIARVTGTKDSDPDQIYLIPNPPQQYLLQTGRTLFKGMSLDDVHRLQLDIEVFTAGTFPHAQRPEDRIILIALSDNRGWHCILDGRQGSEQTMLAALVQQLRERDPD